MRVLFLTHRLPYAPNRGDRVRARHIITALRPVMDVELVSLVHDADEAAAVEQTARDFDIRVHPLPVPYIANRLRGMATLAGRRPLTFALLDSPQARPVLDRIVAERRPDVVFAYCSSMARFAVEPPLAGIPLVLDMVDVDSAKWAALGAMSGGALGWVYRREARVLAAFEREAIGRAQHTFVVNDREANLLRAMDPRAAVSVLPLGVDVATLAPPTPPTDDPRVVFCGVMNYQPNVQGVCWFAEHVWPEVRRSCPEACFTIVGSDPTPAVRRLASSASGIEVTGRVPDVKPYLWRSGVAVAPLLLARGSQNKVLEAVAAGLPAVVTSEVLAGLPNEVKAACDTADAPGEFARLTLRLLRADGGARRAAAARANLAALTWERQMARLPKLVAAAATTTATTPRAVHADRDASQPA